MFCESIVMRKCLRKINTLLKLGTIGFVLNFTGLFIMENNILPTVIVLYGCYTLYTNRVDYLMIRTI